ncbi:unnamed protein product [Mesocestoides corti]|uniref:Uncharacterized protein n=1 Tax=Mesocestoides corti TaxID=53468 RepID=A0A0R3UHQ5_MESCO|nr:unnamed protein product [Mesocestoides corti]
MVPRHRLKAGANNTAPVSGQNDSKQTLTSRLQFHHTLPKSVPHSLHALRTSVFALFQVNLALRSPRLAQCLPTPDVGVDHLHSAPPATGLDGEANWPMELPPFGEHCPPGSPLCSTVS